MGKARLRAPCPRVFAAPRQRVGTAHAVEPVAGILRACVRLCPPYALRVRPRFRLRRRLAAEVIDTEQRDSRGDASEIDVVPARE